MSSGDSHWMRRHWPLVGVVAFAAIGVGAWMLFPRHEQGQPADQRGAPHGQDSEVAYYTCPMHPSVREPSPGKCPICGMKLTPVKLDTGGSPAAPAVPPG